MIGSGPREIADGELRLREITPRDSEDLYRWRMEPGARAMFLNTGVVPFETHQAFLARYFRPDNTDRWFVVEVRGEPVGAVALYDVAADGTEAEWGRFVIEPGHRGRGWGRRSLALLIEYARSIGMQRLHCEVLAGNDTAAGLYRRLGFVETGSYEEGGRRFLRLAARLTPMEDRI